MKSHAEIVDIEPGVTGVILDDEELGPGLYEARLLTETVQHIKRGYWFIERRWRFEPGLVVESFDGSEGRPASIGKPGDYFRLLLAWRWHPKRLETANGENLTEPLREFIEEAEDPLGEL